MYKAVIKNDKYYMLPKQNGYATFKDSLPSTSGAIPAPSITATSGWTNPKNAFDGSQDTYASCGTATDYIQLTYSTPVIITGITGYGNYKSKVSRAMNLRLYSVVNGTETLLCTTSGCTNSTAYTTSGTCTATTASIFRIRLSEKNQEGHTPATTYPSRMKEIILS